MHHMPEDAAIAQDIPDSRHTWMKGMGLRHTEHELGTCVCCTNVCTAPVVDGVVEGGRIGRRGVEGGEPSSTKRVTHLHAIRPLGTPFLRSDQDLTQILVRS